MKSCRWRRLCKNYLKYLSLKKNPDYLEVTFDWKSGGVSAMHRLHQFDKVIGLWGTRRGDYERHIVKVFRAQGRSIVLQSESSLDPVGQKHYDAILDYHFAEIKTIESSGRWAVRTKIADAMNQGAETIILFFADASLFSLERIHFGLSRCLSSVSPIVLQERTITLICVVENEVVIDKTIKPPG